MYNLHQQYLDTASGFHIIELRDQRGNRHLIQLAVGHETCAACGAVHPKNNLEALDPVVAVQQVVEALNASQEHMLLYAAKHGLRVK
jgi:hypothetical protein